MPFQIDKILFTDLYNFSWVNIPYYFLYSEKLDTKFLIFIDTDLNHSFFFKQNCVTPQESLTYGNISTCTMPMLMILAARKLRSKVYIYESRGHWISRLQ